MRYSIALSVLVVLAACGTNSDELKQLKDSQREMQAKIAQLEKKVEQLGRPAPAPAQARPNPNAVYKLPVGNSPFKGPADAPVVLTEFADFQ